jgi:hypothetical protein
MRFSAGIAATLLLASAALAQPGTSASGDLPRRYHVELIVYTHTDANRAEEDLHHGVERTFTGPVPRLLDRPDIELESVLFSQPSEPEAEAEDEAAPEDNEAVLLAPEPEPGDFTAIDFTTNATALADDGLELIERPGPGSDRTLTPLPEAFRTLAGDELELLDVRGTLERLRAYDVLGHAGWVQTGVAENEAVAVDLGRLGITNPTGTVKVWLRTRFHVAVDLEYSDGEGTLWTSTGGADLAAFGYAEQFRLEDEHNAFQLEQLVRLEHPLFSALVYIYRAPEPEDEAQTENAGGPAG